MANPQPDQFTKLSNELLDNLLSIRIPGEAMQIFLVILRKTYGFQKKQDAISMSQFSELTGIAKPHCFRAIEKLEKMNLIIVNRSKNVSIYSVQKDYEKWQVLPKKVTDKSVTQKGNEVLPKKAIHIAQKGNEVLPLLATTKEETIKEKKKGIPTLKEFLEYARTIKIYKLSLEYSLEAKYNQWIENKWKDGNNKKISNWKTKLQNTMPYLKEVNIPKQQTIFNSEDYLKSKGIGC